MSLSFGSTSRLAGLMVLACGLALGVATPGALGQARQVTMTNRIGPGGGGDGMISKRSLENYADMLAMSKEQRDTAMTFHEGYQAAYRQARKEQQEALSDLRRSADESGDQSVFLEKLPEIQEAMTNKAKSLEKQLMSDVKSILNGQEQEGKWGRVERARRREVGLRGATVPGAGVDLTSVVLGLRLPAEQATALNAPIEEYEMELDRLIQSSPKSEGLDFKPGQPIQIDEDRIAKMQKNMAEAREHALKLKDVNQRNASKLEGAMPEDRRAAFKDEVRKATFPQVYRTPRVLKEIDSAMTLSDLTSEQKSQLQSLRESYERDAKPINDSWASALDSAAKNGEGSPIGLGGGVISMGEEDAELAKTKKSRRALDDSTRDKMKKALNPGQLDRMPKIEDDEAPGPMGGASIMTIQQERGR